MHLEWLFKNAVQYAALDHHQHNQNHCHFALRGKIFRTLTLDHLRFILSRVEIQSIFLWLLLDLPLWPVEDPSPLVNHSSISQKTKKERFLSRLLQINKILSPTENLIIGEKQKNTRWKWLTPLSIKMFFYLFCCPCIII